MRDLPTLILAAGRASRMGTPKTLLKRSSDGAYWIDVQIQSLEKIGLSRNTVVFGHHAEKECMELSHVRSVVNTEPNRGPFSSIQTGLAKIHHPKTALYILPIDVPVPDANVWKSLDEALCESCFACVPEFDGKRGHPVLLSPRAVNLISKAPAHERLDWILQRQPKGEVKMIAVTDKKTVMNLNTPSDWSAYWLS